MDLNQLKSKGGFVDSEPVKKHFVWNKSGEKVEFDAFVVRQSFGDIEKMFSDEDDERSRGAIMISEMIRLGENGEERISYGDAYRLDPGLASAFVEAINKVSGVEGPKS